MLVKTKVIVISALKYQEKSLIVKCFTQSDGLKSYFVRDAFSHKKSNHKIGYFQPLTILEIEAVHKNKGTLESFKEVRLATAFHSIPNSIIKGTIAMFLSEVLHHSIHEEEKNESLFDYLEAALLWFDDNDDVADFHLILLLQMTRFLGFFPSTAFEDGEFFEMIEGTFSPYHAITCLSRAETEALKKLMSLNFGNETFFSGNQRSALLTILLDYYSYHLDGFRRPKSLDVLKEVFS